jgi:hypothetical protein
MVVLVLLLAALVQCGDGYALRSPGMVSHAVAHPAKMTHGEVFHAMAGLVNRTNGSRTNGSTLALRAQMSKATNLEKMVLRIVSTSGHGQSPSGLQDIVDLVWPVLEDLEESINASHQAAEETLNASQVGFGTCTNARENGQNDAANLLGGKQSLSTSHRNCRIAEGEAETAFASCEQQRHILGGARNSSCDAYQAAILIPNVNLCSAPTSGEEYGHWLVRVRDWATAELSHLETLRTACEEAESAYNNQTSLCQGADGNGGLAGAHAARRHQCNLNQTALQEQACSYGHAVQSTCEAYETCYNSNLDTWNAQSASVRAGESARIQQWWVVQRIRCYFHLFAEADGNPITPSMIEECRNAGHDTTHLNLTYPTLPSHPSTCSLVENIPCSEGYISSEYSSLPANAQAMECTACATIGGGGGFSGPSDYQLPASVTSQRVLPVGSTAQRFDTYPSTHVARLDENRALVAFHYRYNYGRAQRYSVLQFDENKQASLGPVSTLAPPSSLSSNPDVFMSPHYNIWRTILPFDSSSVVGCYEFRSQSGAITNGQNGEIHCFVLHVSGDTVSNADVAVDNHGRRLASPTTGGQWQQFGFDRVPGENSFVACWKRVSTTSSPAGLGCALFLVSDGAVTDVGGELLGGPASNPAWSLGTFVTELRSLQFPAVAALSGTSAVVCMDLGGSNTADSGCGFLSWTAGNLNSLAMDPSWTWNEVQALDNWVGRLSDNSALWCYTVRRWRNADTPSTGSESQGPRLMSTECSIYRKIGSEEPQTTPAIQWDTSNDARPIRAWGEMLGTNKAVISYGGMRRRYSPGRNGGLYSMALDIDAAGTVTQAGAELPLIPNPPQAVGNFMVGALTPERPFSIGVEGGLATEFTVVPQW